MSENSTAMQKQSAADELKSLADKFLESQDVATKPEDVNTDVKGPGMNILIGIPTPTPSTFDRQLKICREEYRRRHPKQGI